MWCSAWRIVICSLLSFRKISRRSCPCALSLWYLFMHTIARPSSHFFISIMHAFQLWLSEVCSVSRLKMLVMLIFIPFHDVLFQLLSFLVVSYLPCIETVEHYYRTKHRVKTKTGVSKDCFQRSPELLIEGMGQGSAGSMPAWHGHTEAMHTVYKQLMPGCKISNPTGSINFEQHLLSFVDDNKMFFSFPPETTKTEILQRCSTRLQIWQTLLNITRRSVRIVEMCSDTNDI